MISPQDRCLFSCVSSTRSAHKKPFHSGKTAPRVSVCPCTRLCGCEKTHRVSESPRDHLFARKNGEHTRRLSCRRRVTSTQTEDVKSLVELVLMQSMLQAGGTERVVARSRTPARLHTHTHTHSQIHQDRLHSSHSSYKDECSQLSHQLQLHLQRTHVSAVYGFDYFFHFFFSETR